MIELERLRQEQTNAMLKIAADQKEIAASHATIAADHAETARQHAQSATILNRLVERSDDEATAFNDYTKGINEYTKTVNTWFLRFGIAGLIIAAIGIGLALFQVDQQWGTQTVIAVTPTPVPPTLVPPTATAVPPTPATLRTP